MPYGNETYEVKGIGGYDAAPTPPPASIKTKIDQTNKAIAESMLALQDIIFTITGTRPDIGGNPEDKSMFDAVNRMCENAHVMMNMAHELVQMIAG